MSLRAQDGFESCRHLVEQFERKRTTVRNVQRVDAHATAMPQPLVVDSGAAETVILRTRFPNHKTVESEGSKRGVFYTTADGSAVENEGEKTLLMSTSDGVNKALRSVSKMVRNGNRVVFDASGSYTENKMTKDVLWLRERDGVVVVDMLVAPTGREQKSRLPFGRRSMQQGS